MINRYAGNTGRIVRVEEAPPPRREMPQNEPPQAIHQERPSRPKPEVPPAAPRTIPAPPSGAMRPAKSAAGIGGELSKLLGKLSPLDMETEDLILMMILYLLYKETDDKEFLIAMGAMLLL